MRIVAIAFLLFFISCKSTVGKQKSSADIAGQWLILYPDHQLKNSRERQVYTELQDSIVGLSGLKLVSFSKDGSFRQMDSLDKQGKWIVSENKLLITGGGKGFDEFRADVVEYTDDELQLAEYVRAKGVSIKLVWHFKKVNKSASENLFEVKNNSWRIKPTQRESDEAIRKRLSEMLTYYSDYYKLVVKESSYFVPERVVLPLAFYQHAIGLRPLKRAPVFANLFFDSTQAVKAHLYLEETLFDLRGKFPRRENYVEEYAIFMKQMAEEVKKL